MGDVLRILNEKRLGLSELSLSAGGLLEIIRLVDSGKVNISVGRSLLDEVVETGKSPEEIVREKGLLQISDEGELEEIARRVIENNPKPVEDYKRGKKAAIGFLVGQVMRETRGRANPKKVSAVIVRLLSPG